MPVSPARAAAFDILLRVERESAYASELLHSTAYDGLSIADHALATELVMGVLRWRSALDEEIGVASSRRLAQLDLEVLIVLRLGLYQMRRLDRIPERASVNESVELVRRARKHSAAPFVNAVLRKLSRPSDVRPEPRGHGNECDSPGKLARSLAHPQWLVERWASEYGLAAARTICEYDQSVPVTAVRLRKPSAEETLAADGVRCNPGALLTSASRVVGGDIARTVAFRRGELVIQDEASQLVAALVGHGSNILDCCAAPGGKTLALADRNPDATITAVELHAHRARRLREFLRARLGTTTGTRLRTLAADARKLPLEDQFDRILVDVPCSGTGTLARNPEIKWKLNVADLDDLHSRQVAIFQSALGRLAPGGRLVYSTCSLEREENEDVVEQVLRQNTSIRVLDCNVELERLKAEGELIWRTPRDLTRGPYLHTLPGLHPCDGFFAALLEKAAAE
jgi:16S rRNA (cytosine967-C5)-methyltransferase